MADDGGGTPDFGKTHKFPEVFQEEIEVINQRRRGPTLQIEVDRIDVVENEAGEPVYAEERQTIITAPVGDRPPRPEITLEKEATDVTGEDVWRPDVNANVVGLALSGGGIRSAAFCLGVLQALHKSEVLDKVDYLSTVSGGGYIGCSLTAAQQANVAQGLPAFPFASALKEDEPLALQHIRDYSNYLFPSHGSGGDILHNVAIYARGLVANAVIVAPFLFGIAALTLLCYARREAITKLKIFGVPINPFDLHYFFLTLDLFIAMLVVGVLWALFQSLRVRQEKTEIPGWPAPVVGGAIVALLVVAFAELQPFILDALIQAKGNPIATAQGWITTITALFAPVSAAFAYLSGKVGEYVKSAMQSTSLTAQTKGLVMKAAIVIGGLILPVLLWMLYLELSYWGLSIKAPNCPSAAMPWLVTACGIVDWRQYAATILYILIAAVCVCLSLLMQPNANSLHPLYRDRLGKAFIFRPWPQRPPLPQADADLVEEWRPKLSEITGRDGPYHLINTALNVEASKVANRRGRNADFFIFSPQFVGSKSTGYVRTAEMEEVATALNLPTAMAASGAAVSSEMGAQNIRALSATLALLNVRLGYWLRNPKHLSRYGTKPRWYDLIGRFSRHHNIVANYYFIGEILGLLSEKTKSVYLTDGGHIDNTGIYELLRRRCAVIIAVDAEADPQMAFGSFNTMERYALIDMGIRIDLPWQPIAKSSVDTGKALDDSGDAPKNHGPHCAIGEISYPDGRKGVLVYIKASLTGDENDTVIDYKKRYSAFPHETTLDQMFTEEQFEAYRALGFHAAFRLFDRDDEFAHLNPNDVPDAGGPVQSLDRLFPRPKPDGKDPPHQKTTFAAWLKAGKSTAKAAGPQAADRHEIGAGPAPSA